MNLPRALSIASFTALPILAADKPYPWPGEPQFVLLTLERIVTSKIADQVAWSGTEPSAALAACKTWAEREK